MTLEVKEKFYQQDTVTMAKELLGKIMILKNENEIFAGYIIETEAYLGEFDKACHGYGNKKTPKVEALFEKAGTVYIYTMHTHKMLNIVSCEEGDPQAVLIRAVEPILNVNIMEENRGKSGILVSNGPGKLTKAFGIDDRFNKTEIQIIEKNMFEIEELTEKLKNKNFGIKYDISKINEKYLYLDFENSKIPRKIETSARIGIPNKGIWTEKKLRFFVKGNKFVSGMKKVEMKEKIWK
jgi:DNA-3-methyladenine glycosylase